MVSWGDVDGGDPTTGESLAAYYAVNPAGAVEQAYVDSGTLDNEGDGCGTSHPSYYNGGINGCGCFMIESISSSAANASYAFNESWYSLGGNAYFQNGTGYWYWNAGCNYDPSTYPWQGGG